MAEFEVTYGFNVRRFVRGTIEADTPEHAIEIARGQARDKIQEEVNRIESSDGFGSHERWNASMFIDHSEAPTYDTLVMFEGELPELDD